MAFWVLAAVAALAALASALFVESKPGVAKAPALTAEKAALEAA